MYTDPNGTHPTQGAITETVFKKHSDRTVKAAVLAAELEQLLVGFIGRSEDKHPRVEAVWPTGIWCCGQLLSLKELIYI